MRIALHSRVATIALAAASISASPAAWAQTGAGGGQPSAAAGDTDHDEPSAKRANGGIAEIIVTARRREETLQDVPAAVTAVTGADLVARSVANVSEVAAITPNLRFAEGGRGPTTGNITLRGMNTGNLTIANDPAVGVYFDEVYLARSAGALFTSVVDMAGVQVLRGNQGTLFGRNSTGGAILLTPNRPNLYEREGSAWFGYGNYDRIEYGGILSVPIVEGKLAVRGSFQQTQRDPIAHSLTTGVGYGDRNRFVGRASVRWQPIDDLTFDVTYDYTRVNEAGGTSRNISVPAPAGINFYDTLSGIQNPTAYVNSKGWTFKGEYRASPEFGTKVILGYRTLRTNSTRDADGLPMQTVDARFLTDQDQFSSEIQFSGDFNTDLSWLKKISYIAGFYYFTETGTDTSVVPPDTAVQKSITYGKNDSVAGYAQIDASFTDELTAFGGIRLTRDSRQLRVQSYVRGVCALVGNPKDCMLRGSANFTFPSWTVGLRYKVNDNVSLYAKTGKGQRSGGLDDTPTDIVPFDPEQLQDYEIGAKFDLFDNTVRANLALFTGDYNNIQRSVLLIEPLTGLPYSSVFNAAKGRVRGVEAEATVQPISVLRLSGSVGYTDAKYLEFILPSTGQDVSDNQFRTVPKWTYSLSADLNVPTDVGEFSARVDYNYQSTVQFELINNPLAVQKGYGLLNARIGFIPELTIAGLRPEISFFGKNLTNKDYNVEGSTFAGLGTVMFRSSDPRTYGFDVRVKF